MHELLLTNAKKKFLYLNRKFYKNVISVPFHFNKYKTFFLLVEWVFPSFHFFSNTWQSRFLPHRQFVDIEEAVRVPVSQTLEKSTLYLEAKDFGINIWKFARSF